MARWTLRFSIDLIEPQMATLRSRIVDPQLMAAGRIGLAVARCWPRRITAKRLEVNAWP
jgi:hypothetical protein